MRRKQIGGLYKVNVEAPNASLEPGKVSEMILEFAAPLLQLAPAGAPDVTTLGNALMMAELCWNLPVFEATDASAYARFRPGFDAVLRAAPVVIVDILNQLIADRTSRFGAVPYLVHVRVENRGPRDARVVAEARMPRAIAARTPTRT